MFLRKFLLRVVVPVMAVATAVAVLPNSKAATPPVDVQKVACAYPDNSGACASGSLVLAFSPVSNGFIGSGGAACPTAITGHLHRDVVLIATNVPSADTEFVTVQFGGTQNGDNPGVEANADHFRLDREHNWSARISNGHEFVCPKSSVNGDAFATGIDYVATGVRVLNTPTGPRNIPDGDPITGLYPFTTVD